MKRFTIAVNLITLSLVLTGCASTNSSMLKATTMVSQEPHLVVVSDHKRFVLSLFPNTTPPPLHQIHDWTLQVKDADAVAVETANIMVYGGMPKHKHGFSTNPKVTQNLGNGNYLIDGIKFNMPGQWEIWLNIIAGKVRDKAVFVVNIK